MNFILEHKYSDGNTPIRPEEAEQLIPQISTMAELNEYEALNILQAHGWAPIDLCLLEKVQFLLRNWPEFLMQKHKFGGNVRSGPSAPLLEPIHSQFCAGLP